MNVRPAQLFDYKPRQPSPFKSELDPLRELQEENPISSQVFEVAHMGTDILLDHAHSGTLGLVGGGASALVSLAAAGWGLARLRSPALPDKIEAVGHLALAGSAGLHALDRLAHVHLPGAPALEVVHGLATAGLGASELLRARREGGHERKLVGAMEIAMGFAIVGAGLLGHFAPVLHLAAAGALAVKEVVLNSTVSASPTSSTGRAPAPSGKASAIPASSS